MAFSRVGTGRGPLECNRAGPHGAKGAKHGSTDSHCATPRFAGGPATTVYTQAIGAANALRRKHCKTLKKLRSIAAETELEREIARNARQVGLGLRSGLWLPTNAIAKTSSSIDNQPREGTKRGARHGQRRSPSPPPTPRSDPIAAQVAAGGAAQLIEAHLAANAALEQAYLDERKRDNEQLESLASDAAGYQALAKLAQIQSLLSETELMTAQGAEYKPTPETLPLTLGPATADEDLSVLVPYRQQSSKRLNTDAANVARKQLRDDPLVSVAVDRLWLLAIGYGHITLLDRQTFLNFHILVQKALDLDSSFDVFEAERAAVAEWEADTVSPSGIVGVDNRMSHQQFHDSLFELVDIWTCEINAQAYGAFLWQLLQRISCICIVFDDSLLDDFRTREIFSHDRRGAAAWETVRRCHQGQEFAARYSLKALDEVLPWNEQPPTAIYTHPQLFKVSEAPKPTVLGYEMFTCCATKCSLVCGSDRRSRLKRSYCVLSWSRMPRIYTARKRPCQKMFCAVAAMRSLVWLVARLLGGRLTAVANQEADRSI